MNKEFFEVWRYSSGKDSTLGLLMYTTGLPKFLCYTLEDEKRTEKIFGKTRIPEGKYRLELKTWGGFHQRYSSYDFHEGMLWLRGVPNFEDVLIHKGNDDEDTAGCLLLANTSTENVTQRGFIGHSAVAYERVYPFILDKLKKTDDVFIRYRNFDLT